jgi:hypothetical protein
MFDTITEADEAATDKETALRNLEAQILRDETVGVIQMYEDAALNTGCTVAEVGAVFVRCRLLRKR